VLAREVQYTARMSWLRIAGTVLVIGWLALPTGAVTNDADSQDRNYRVIIDRNPFGLKPPPPPVTNAPPPVAQKDEILLTGITSLGQVRAYFMTKAPQGKNPEYYSLGVDEKKDGLEILEIDPASKSVRVRNAGLETVMNFSSNGVKPPAGPTAAPGAPGAPALAGIAPSTSVPPPLTTLTAPGIAAGNSRLRTIPSRNGRMPQPNMMPEIAPNQPPVAPNPHAAEQDVLLMELQRKVNPNVSFPPTPMPQ
jgi:hypothetical protein